MKTVSLLYTLLALLIFTFSATASSLAKETIPPIYFGSYYLDIYGGEIGFHTGEPFRAKLTLQRSGGIAAEIYFYDKVGKIPATSTELTYPNPPSRIGGYCVLRFPMSTLGPILQQLRFSRGTLTLCYVGTEWFIRSTDEPIVHPMTTGTPPKKR